MFKRVGMFSIVLAALSVSGQGAMAAWSFGVIDDTQWVTGDSLGQNPNAVAVSIINQVNPQFVSAGVKFVVQVGDLTENGNSADLQVRDNANANLYAAGIGYYPLRGNHESSQTAATSFQTIYGQTQGTTAHSAAGVTVVGGSSSSNLNGLSYAFQYDNARFVMLDQFTRTDGSGTDANNNMVDQVSWVDSTLSSKPAGTHAFVFSHKQLIGENHMDSLFGANPNPSGTAQTAQNQFIGSLQNNGVRYLITGHDHIHQRSIVTSQDGNSQVMEIIGGSDSNKYYTPQALTASGWNGAKSGTTNRETSIAQDMNRVGYYIYTIDGARVQVQYYGSNETTPGTGGTMPTLHFALRETFGYSLNGLQKLVGPGQSYALTDDTTLAMASETGYLGTAAGIVSGTNGSTKADYTNRLPTHAVNTGWSPAVAGMTSDVLQLWGMEDVNTTTTDPFVLKVNYKADMVSPSQLISSKFGLQTKDGSGNWVMAGSQYMGDVDPGTIAATAGNVGKYGYYDVGGEHVAWAVVNHDGSFSVSAVPEPSTIGLLGSALMFGSVIVIRRRFAPRAS